MTADHCALAGGLAWNHNEGSWATGVQSDPGKDAILMRASVGSSFNSASVWVGSCQGP